MLDKYIQEHINEIKIKEDSCKKIEEIKNSLLKSLVEKLNNNEIYNKKFTMIKYNDVTKSLIIYVPYLDKDIATLAYTTTRSNNSKIVDTDKLNQINCLYSWTPKEELPKLTGRFLEVSLTEDNKNMFLLIYNKGDHLESNYKVHSQGGILPEYQYVVRKSHPIIVLDRLEVSLWSEKLILEKLDKLLLINLIKEIPDSAFNIMS